jgi:hypothetical protein
VILRNPREILRIDWQFFALSDSNRLWPPLAQRLPNEAMGAGF